MESEETVAPAAEAPAVDTAPAPEAAAAPEGSASDTEVNPSTTEQPAAFPSADEFGWDAWKGEVDNLPEQIRGWATPMQGYYQKWADDKAASMVDDAKSLKELYDSLLEGKEDPRVAEYTAKLKEMERRKARQVRVGDQVRRPREDVQRVPVKRRSHDRTRGRSVRPVVQV
jgi:hypothetical protein